MRIVVVSPSLAERGALQSLLQDDGHEVLAAATRAEAYECAHAVDPAAFIADTRVVGIDGLAVSHELTARGLRPRVILLCARESRCSGGRDVMCLTKPIDIDKLRRCLAEERVEIVA